MDGCGSAGSGSVGSGSVGSGLVGCGIGSGCTTVDVRVVGCTGKDVVGGTFFRADVGCCFSGWYTNRSGTFLVG